MMMRGREGTAKAKAVELTYDYAKVPEYQHMLIHGAGNPERVQAVKMLVSFARGGGTISEEAFDALREWFQEGDSEEAIRELALLGTMTLVVWIGEENESSDEAMAWAELLCAKITACGADDEDLMDTLIASLFCVVVTYHLDEVESRLLTLLLPGKASKITPSRSRAIQVAPYIATSKDAAVLGTLVTAALQAHDEELAVAACTAFATTLDIFGASAGLDRALLDKLPLPDQGVPRHAIEKALKPFLEFEHDASSAVVAITASGSVGGTRRMMVQGLEAINRIPYIRKVYGDHTGNIPANLLQLLLGPASEGEKDVFHFRSQTKAAERQLQRESKDRKRERGQARDAKQSMSSHDE